MVHARCTCGLWESLRSMHEAWTPTAQEGFLMNHTLMDEHATHGACGEAPIHAGVVYAKSIGAFYAIVWF